MRHITHWSANPDDLPFEFFNSFFQGPLAILIFLLLIMNELIFFIFCFDVLETLRTETFAEIRKKSGEI